ncbi:MAG: PqqD family protein [Bacteriovoracaceae bacterium]|nr:PqqD family protein [Bacteriovoracaceae bacterium]
MSNFSHLAVNDNGFLFDPTSGQSFTLNTMAQEVMSAMKEGKDVDQIARELSHSYEVSYESAYEDVLEFGTKLKLYGLSL